MSLLIFCLVLLLLLHLISFMDLTITHMVLVLIVVIVPRIGTIFLLECLTLALSQETWTIHIFSVVVHVPLAQMVRCKRL
jgi:hypothetical protein